MPLDQVKVVLTVTDPAVRDEVIAEHLRSMERQLEQTKTAVASLRRLLEGRGPPSLDFAFQTFTSAPALLVSARVAWDETFVWLRDTLVDLRREIGSDADLRGGPDGAIYSAEFFESHVGEVTAFIPLSASAGDVGGLLPAGPVAVAVHRGSFSELDRTSTALGGFVAEQGLGSRARTAIRENYLVSQFNTDDERGLVTEVCWPVLPTRGNEES
jgi:effector-binding domain-containing protein